MNQIIVHRATSQLNNFFSNLTNKFSNSSFHINELIHGIQNLKIEDSRSIQKPSQKQTEPKAKIEVLDKYKNTAPVQPPETLLNQIQLVKSFPRNKNQDVRKKQQEKDKSPVSTDKTKQKEQFKPSSISEIKSFCENLKVSFNQKVFNKSSVSNFYRHIQEVFSKNSNLCIQQSFERLKANYHPNKEHPKLNKNDSYKTAYLSSSEFNLQLTYNSKNSKNYNHFDPRDSLIYSNATSFGLANTQNKSKPLSKTAKRKVINIDSSEASKDSSLKSVKIKDETDIAHIDRASSRGEVHSANSISDNELVNKYPPKSKKNCDQKKNNSQKSNIKNNSSTHLGIPIREQDDYEILPLTQEDNTSEQNTQKKQKSHFEAQNNSIGVKNKKQNSVKKSFSIKKYNDNLKSSRSSEKKGISGSVFSIQLSNLQSRISKIKEIKLAKKLELQQQLRKINQQIQQIKNEESQFNSNVKQKPLHKMRQNTIESRIKINDDIEGKKKAVNLVKNLRADKISRENQKRNKIKVLDQELHQEIEDIMKLKYFNQEKVKQKRKLQIIERMKQQEIRKITQQKQKNQSVEFLSKLKQATRQDKKEKQTNYLPRPFKNQHDSPAPIKKQHDSPTIKQKLQANDVKESSTTPTLQKKKAFLNKMRNFTIIKKKQEDIYQQVLN